MFAKPYKLKSNNTLKNSEKKHLGQRIQDEFPSATEEKVKELVPLKSSCICMKLVLHSGDLVNVYSVDGLPMLIETAEGLVPTVCALWKVPDLIPMLTIHTPVLAKMQGGAPLYVPGLEVRAGGAGFPMFGRGALAAARTQDCAAAALVGRAVLASADMLLRPTGVCLETIHILGDQLCKDAKFSKIERPKLGPPAHSQEDITVNLAHNITQLSIQAVKEEWPSLCRGRSPAVDNAPRVIADQPAAVHAAVDAAADGNEDELEDTISECSQIEDNIPSDMDGLLRWCLLSFLKLEAKSVELPLKTNLLYRNHLIALCPPEHTLDVKKSSYKKLGKFLEAMQKEGLVEVREIDKGVDALVALNPAHPLVRSHVAATHRAAPAASSAEAAEYSPPLVREMYCVTAAVAELLAPHKKGTALTSGEVRSALTEYVKLRQLHVSGAVALDAPLAKAAGKQLQATVKWDVLMSSVLAKMTASTEMRFSDGTVRLTKTKLEPIKMQVVSRSGNKKVTLVSNLEAFGFSLAALSHACQSAVAAACGVTRSAGAKCDQLMLQGDQTHFVAKLLIEKYGLPKKFVEGADKALNKKK